MHSPISYVQNVNTPTLILHGEADVRVPISQAYERYFALKRQGVPVEMVVFPRQGHAFQEPKVEVEFRRRLHDLVAKYTSGNRSGSRHEFRALAVVERAVKAV